MKKIVLILITILFFETLYASKKTSYCTINWKEGKISAIGTSKILFNSNGTPTDSDSGLEISLNKGRMQAYKKAKNIATNLLVNQIFALQIDTTNKFENYLSEYNYTQTKLGTILRENTKIKKIPSTFDSAKCKIELSLGEIISTIPKNYPEDNFPTNFKNQISTKYSSLIIDTRSVIVKPMILPVIYNKNGLEIYNHYFINIKEAIKKGMVSYVYSETQAKKHIKSGNKPYFTVAISELKGSPVLSNRDIERIFSSQATISKLKKCNVIFIIRKNKKGNK